MLRLTFFAVIAVFGALSVRPAAAWNSPGHILIALTAYEQMDAATRASAVGLLRSHPRFREHFEQVMPKEVKRMSGAEQDRWFFAHAATWPDMVRGGYESGSRTVSRADSERFNRVWWHFINEPVFVSPEDQRAVAGELRLNVRRDPPSDDDEEFMNIVQAFKNSSRIVRDQYQPKDKRAVHLCWLLHLAGDSHQPMHAVTLVSARRFRKGDQGGNFLDIEYDWSLHSFWDSQVSTDDDFETQLRLAENLKRNTELMAAGKKAARSRDIGEWIDESHELAVKFGYTPDVIEKVAAREGHTHLGPLNLPAQYRVDAERVAERRAAEAAFRLAAALEELLSGEEKPRRAKPQAAARP